MNKTELVAAMASKADLSKKDEQFREFSLNGPMWRVVLYVGFPLRSMRA